jgi:hypothetical protein
LRGIGFFIGTPIGDDISPNSFGDVVAWKVAFLHMKFPTTRIVKTIAEFIIIDIPLG